MSKRCSICKSNKDIRSFYKTSTKIFAYCKECSKEKSRIWYSRNREVHNSRSLARMGAIRKNCITLLGGECKGCGTTDHRVLCFDHINGGGTKERTSLASGSGMLYRIASEIVSTPGKYQLLCFNCNWLKAISNKEL